MVEGQTGAVDGAVDAGLAPGGRAGLRRAREEVALRAVGGQEARCAPRQACWQVVRLEPADIGVVAEGGEAARYA